MPAIENARFVLRHGSGRRAVLSGGLDRTETMIEIESDDRKAEEALREAIEPLVSDLREEVQELRQEVQALRRTEDPERLLDKAEAADLLGVSERTVDTLIHSGEIASLKVRRARRIPYRALQAYIERRVDGGGPDCE